MAWRSLISHSWIIVLHLKGAEKKLSKVTAPRKGSQEAESKALLWGNWGICLMREMGHGGNQEEIRKKFTLVHLMGNLKAVIICLLLAQVARVQSCMTKEDEFFETPIFKVVLDSKTRLHPTYPHSSYPSSQTSGQIFESGNLTILSRSPDS